jgi:Arc/MetJ-type ribon-helix-helix transcriptional regulator
MSNQLHSGESDRRKQVKFRADAELVSEFDEWVDQSDDYQSRADALRGAMRQMLGDSTDAPLQPPADDDLRTAYLTMVQLANSDGIVPDDLATAELSVQLGQSERIVRRAYLAKLRERAYLGYQTNFTGSERSWTVRGLDG